MRGQSLLLATTAIGLLTACSDGLVVTPPTGAAYTYVGSVSGSDNADAPLSPENCHYVATLNPKTGPLGAVGLPLENAAKLAVKELNEAGPINGRSICLISGDTRTDSEFAAQLIKDIAADYDIRAVNGAAASSASANVAAYLTSLNLEKPISRRIAQVSCCSTSPVFSSDRQLLRTVPSDALQGVVLAKLAREQLDPPAERISVIFIGDIYGQSLADVFSQKFEELGGTLVQAAEFTTGAADYFDVLEQAFKGNPDSVLLVAFPGDGAQILRDWRTSGLAKEVRWLATDGLREDRFVQGAGNGTIDYLVGTAPVLKGDYFGTFDSRYRRELNNEAPGVFTSNQYDAMMLIGLGLARAGNSADVELANAIRDVSTPTTGASVVSIDDLRSALAKAAAGESIDYEGASGSVNINATGDSLSNYRVWRVDKTQSRIVESECNWICSRTGTDDCQVINPMNCKDF